MRRPLALLVAAAAGAAAALTAVPMRAAVADEVTARPPDGVFDVSGRGYGHGRGLSQYGAQGAAGKGVTATAILSAYYRNTAQVKLADRQVRVLISADEGVDVTVLPVSGLAVRDSSSGAVYELPSGPRYWRLVVDANGSGIQYYDTIWHRWGAGPSRATTLPGPLTFQAAAPIQLVLPGGSRRELRGTLTAARTGTARLATVNTLSLEHYLYGVLPREMPAGWRAEALKAQAVAARSYSLNKINRAPAGAAWDICDTIQCQVYGGVRTINADGSVTASEQPSTNAAVEATRGIVRTYNGTVILSEFSSSNGGHTAPGTVAYMQAHPDSWDGIASPHTTWGARVQASTLESKFPSVGRLERVRVTDRDGYGEYGGRVVSVVLEGQSDSGEPTEVPVSGNNLRTALGLKSTYLRIQSVADSAVVARSSYDARFTRSPGVPTGTMAVILRNTGTVPWDADAVHLALASPAGGGDALAGGSTTPGRFIRNVTSPGAETVDPGESAEFRVYVDASTVPAGSYLKSYRLRQGTGPLFGATVSWRVTVADAVFKAALVTLQPTAIVVPANGYARTYVDVVNTGTLDWQLGGPVRSGTWGMVESPSSLDSWLSPSQPGYIAANLSRRSDVVRPGEKARFLIYLGGNGRPAGRYTETFTVLWHGYRWSGLPLKYTYDVR